MKYPKTLALSPEAFDKFIKTCENPPPPSQALKDMVREYGHFSNPNATTRLTMAEVEADNLVKATCPHLNEAERAKVVRKIIRAIKGAIR